MLRVEHEVNRKFISVPTKKLVERTIRFAFKCKYIRTGDPNSSNQPSDEQLTKLSNLSLNL